MPLQVLADDNDPEVAPAAAREVQLDENAIAAEGTGPAKAVIPTAAPQRVFPI